ncbi:MAG: hypothetical protein JNK85_08075 [Verrucomicrobiales bacterium]|nr:hypothetical protein [Verrucomicrobiales bacterium]
MRLAPRELRQDPAFRGLVRAAAIGGLGLSILHGGCPSAIADAEPTPAEVPAPAGTSADPVAESPWTGGLSLRTWSGYSDNPGLSSVNPQGSAFIAGGGDFTLLRLSEEGDLLTFLVTVERIAYLTRGVNPETIALAEVEFDEGLGGDWTVGGTLDYLYLNQVFDASELVGVPVIIPAEGHQVSVRPKLEWDLTQHWKARAEFEWARQWFAKPLDGFEDRAPKASMLWSDATGTEAGISYTHRWRGFDERTARAADGTSLSETLEYGQHEVEGFAERKWGPSGRWRAQLRGGYRFNGDNGGGFYDYERYHANAGLRYRLGRWEVRADARWRWYQYPVQLAGTAGSPNRRRMEVSTSARLEWKIRDGFRIFAQYAYEMSDENVVAADYRVNSMSGGIEIEM